ncbi:hypothetical protein LOTGIDRAFT_107877 [Lottia gigantea]|uniref:Ionotropic glutamate receptor C-terminal domain-containing protein n=1 Tax=Lottia gigantea TaxID=225164 RepID=V3Z451_LOTGI|nr:hypothetical protein LOTGIDRAFT_107877 [Lottia gigantea]ESO85423.1 hypothetical protein LOTGIDRAFT_107877 [Lottia gigantea]
MPNTTFTYPYEGYCMDIISELAMAMNFTINMTGGSPDNEWGVDNGNGTWSGLIGMLQREEVDLVAGPLTTIIAREKVMDFTFPFYHDFLSVLIKKPDPSLTKWRTMIDPFRWEVLLCIGISLVGASVILFLLEKWNPFYQREPYLNRYAGTHIFQDAFWYMFGAMLTQGGEHLPDSQAGRTMISTWWLFSIIMAATYSGNLIAFLTVTKDTAPFETLDQLIDNGDYTWGLLGGSNNQMEFENSKIPVFQKAWKGILETADPDALSLDHEVHLAKVNVGDYGYISDRGGLQKRVLTDCDLYLLPEKISPINYALALQNGSAYTEIFSKEMMAIYESGLLQIWQRQWWKQKKFCRGPLQTEAKPIDLVDVQSSFYLIGVGLFLAAIALVIERCMLRFCKCRTSSSRRENVVQKPKELQNGHAHKPVENGIHNGIQNGHVRSEIYSSVRKQNGHTPFEEIEIVSNGHMVPDVNGNGVIDSVFDYDTEYVRTSL